MQLNHLTANYHFAIYTVTQPFSRPLKKNLYDQSLTQSYYDARSYYGAC